MKTPATFLFLFLCISGLWAQNSLQGIFTVNTKQGVITLELLNEGNGQYGGTLTMDDSVTYSVQGQGNAQRVQGILTATVNGSTREFDAVRQKSELIFTMQVEKATVGNLGGRKEYVMSQKGKSPNLVNAPPASGVPGGAALPPPGLVYNPQTARYEHVDNVPGGYHYGYGNASPYYPPQPGTAPDGYVFHRPRKTDQPTDFTGEYNGKLKHYVVKLTIEQDKTEFHGHIDATAYQYDLNGYIQGNSVTGKGTEEGEPREFNFEATLNGNSLDIFFWNNDPYLGEVFNYRSRFLKKGAPRPGKFSYLKPQEETVDTVAIVESDTFPLPKDDRLFGLWYLEEMVSGRIQQINLDLRATGSYKYWVDNNSSNKSRINTQERYTGRWYVEEGMLFAWDEDFDDWQPYASYRIDGDENLRLLLGDGKEVKLHR